MGKRVGGLLDFDSRGQVWVETVIYTLIGLAVIGLVLAGALPKINQKRDEMVIGRSIEALGMIDNKVYEVQRAVGNRRVVSLEIRRGIFTIDPDEDTISWVLESSFPYSEVGETIPFGNMDVTTTKDGDYKVELKIKYNIDLQYEGGLKDFGVAPVPYKIIIENTGMNSTGTVTVGFAEA